MMLDTGSRVAVNLAADDRPSWRAFYGAYEEHVRPGAVKEWPIDAIREAIDGASLATGAAGVPSSARCATVRCAIA